MSEPSPPGADELADRLAALGGEGHGRDPEAERWRSDLAAKLFGAPRRDVTIGRYTVLSRVGEGASGVVYAAHDPQLDRKVALKVLRADLALSSGRAAQWLAREAKILARLSHPNVVPVYDVGEDDGRVFVALELVEGRSLRPWMAERHPWPEVVEVLAQAGRGLAAAHAAGLVHRDFKPENVLLGADGRVRVSDFGIARRLASPAEEVALTEISGEAGPAPSASASLTTQRHAGTPGYMAPEQLLGDPVDARTDQFGFCVTLHEALYGERPFAGRTRAGLAANVIAGRRRPGPRGVGVPTWLDRVVARGLEVDPERRYPSMDALLDDLHRRRAGRRRWGIGLTFAAGLTAAALLGRGGSGTPEPCEGGEAKVAAVWSPARVAEIDQAFAATGLPYAEDSARRVEEVVGAYGQAWVQAHASACEGATEEAVMERMYCLQSRLLELESLAELFAQADARVVEHAVASSSALVSPGECIYVGAGQVAGEGDQDQGATEASELRMEIARAKALGDTGQPQQARRLARDAAQRARDLADRTLEAEALLVAGHMERVLMGVVERNDAELTTYSAVLAAEAAHRPDLLARGLVEYLSVTVSLGRIGQAWKWERRAREAVRAIGSPAELMGRIEYTMALAESYAGRLDDSAVTAARSLARFEEGGPTTRRWSSTAENLIGELTFERGDYAEALPHYERALDIAVEEMGPEHTWVASAHGNMAEVFFLTGRYDEAQRHFEEALRIREGCFGPTSVWVIHTLAHLGDVAMVRGEPQAALALYRQALDARAELRRMAGDRPANGDETLSVFVDLQAWDQDQWLHHGLALALVELGRVDEARAQVALVSEPVFPRDHHHPDLIARLDVPGWIELAAGALPEAIAAFERALDRMEAELGPRHRYLVYPLLGLGQAHLRRGAPDEARPYLERALRIHEALPEVEPRVRGDLRFGLAQALAAQPERAAEARTLAELARMDYIGAPDDVASRRAELDAWLLEHPSAAGAE
ncbi:MAG: serine/threonine protein kinase [Myxococcales bacterium]|nr:serine/threonine protein kinase [Myxococcales bacterium]